MLSRVGKYKGWKFYDSCMKLNMKTPQKTDEDHLFVCSPAWMLLLISTWCCSLFALHVLLFFFSFLLFLMHVLYVFVINLTLLTVCLACILHLWTTYPQLQGVICILIFFSPHNIYLLIYLPTYLSLDLSSFIWLFSGKLFWTSGQGPEIGNKPFC